MPLAIVGGSMLGAWLGGTTERVSIAGQENRPTHKIYGRPEVARLEDLRAKAVGVSTPGSSASVALIETLRRQEFTVDEGYQILYLREQPAWMAGLSSGAVQGAVLSAPFDEQAKAEGAHFLFDMMDLSFELLSLNIAATRGLLERDPALPRRFLMGYIEGMQYVRDQPEAADALPRATRTGDRAAAEQAHREVRATLDIWSSESAIQVLLNCTDMPNARTARPADMIDDHLPRELEREGWLAAHYQGR